MRRRSAGAAFAVALIAAACGGGAKIVDEPLSRCGRAVFFSVANQDDRTRDAEIKIVVDGKPIVYGSFRSSSGDESADYHYIAAQASGDEITVRAVSPDEGGGLVEARKQIPVKDGIWIVVTRVRDIDGAPQLHIEFSYEGPVASWGESGGP